MKKTEQNINTKLPIFPISTLAQVLGVHQRTLRIYDKEGILTPQRTAKNRRHYSLDDLEKGKLILYLTRNIALNLYGVKLMLAILEKSNIKPEKRLEYLKSMAKIANITEEEQNKNIQKIESKGRKLKSNS